MGSEKITLAHEIVHLHLHKSAFLFAKIIEKDLSQLECRNGGLISADDDPMKWFEIHANGIAPCIAMPKENFIAKYKEYEDIYVASKGSYIEAIESIIKALSDFFGVTRYSVKKRLLDLGIETAQGAFNYADGHYVRPYLFKKGALKNDETFTISFSDFTKLMSEIKNVAYFYKGEFVFVENHLCINSEKYIEKDVAGNDALTHYARTHIDECCVKFKCSSLNEFVAKSTFNSFCYLCRDVAQDIQTIIDFSADNQVLLKDPKFAEKVRQQNDAENEIKRKIAGLDLAGTLNILKEVFGWKNLAMSLDIEKDQKTIERYLGGKVKNPTIGVVIAMCLAMKLTPDLTCEVLKNAGFSIQSNSVRDKALRTIITSCRGKTIQEVNEILIGLGEEPLT